MGHSGLGGSWELEVIAFAGRPEATAGNRAAFLPALRPRFTG
ncbi:hypothetical protein Hsw_1390 [Hymenobacter swuensis DY53]|uniref:Uncharacterized protein n=1 Tax=Hymenobacter swuensis DY53 TaxID=1227739 RepID=W8F5I1_9BACT|nr:hypothetical protein Hsw_1390 [Hymenobacter swuensis DY53]